MNVNNKYGYKVCYRELGKSKLKLFLITNTFDLPVWHVRWYKRDPPHKINNPLWEIHEVTTRKEYEKLWKCCPFKDDLNNFNRRINL